MVGGGAQIIYRQNIKVTGNIFLDTRLYSDFLNMLTILLRGTYATQTRQFQSGECIFYAWITAYGNITHTHTYI